VQIFSVKHSQFIVKNTFKATYFGSTEPSSGLFVRTDPYPCGSVLTKRPDNGSVEPKHVALNVFLTINWMCLTEKNLQFLYIELKLALNISRNVRLGWCRRRD